MDSTTLEIPSYISSRSANSLISFSRPTRIQAITLEALNKILDELLLLILSSAKSLATDRIKSDGILRVLGGQSGSGSGAGALLAKNAVLEAELELRSYLDGQRKEGGKMPLGLSATSRWDGTEGFPVQSAYKALRIRCQYYSTLGELEDPSPNSPQEQNIMSSDGRPIATITPGVAIYVTALLEFVAEYILQNVARVIERDNSDEATLNDLMKAMEEDEGTSFWWNKMQSKQFIQTLDKENGGTGAGKGKVQKPWQVPDADEYDQAAGRKKFQRQSLTSIPPSHSSSSNILNNSSNSRNGPSSAGAHDRTSSSGHQDIRNGSAGSPTFSQQTHATGMTSIPSGSTESGPLKRRPSFDKAGWFGRRRGSFRSSQDLGLAGLGVSTGGIPDKTNARESLSQTTDDHFSGEGGDFDSLVMSGQTMKVSLTPNRLRSMDATADNSQDSDNAKRSARKRPGTGSLLRAETPNTLSTRVSSPTNVNSTDGHQEEQPPRPGSRAGSVNNFRPTSSRGNKAAPPSAYRGLETPEHLEDGLAEEQASSDQNIAARNKPLPPRESINLNNASPVSPMTDGSSFVQTNGRESRMSLISQTSTDTTSRRLTLSGAGGKVMSLFGRKSNNKNASTSSISPSTSANASVDPTLQRSYTSSTFRSAKGVATGSRPNIEEIYNNSRSATPSVAHENRGENRDSVSTTSGAVNPNVVDRNSSDPARASMSPDFQRVNGNIQEEHKESSTGHGDVVNGSDSPNHDDSEGVHTNINGGSAQTTGLIGLYSEPKANVSASTLSSVNHRDSSTSRKVVPWSYNRRRSSGPLINSANRVGSGGSSGHGHGDYGAGGGAPPPPSAWSQNNFDSATPAGSGGSSGGHGSFANAGNTPIIGVSPTFGRTSPSPRPFSMNSKTDIARLLVQLNNRMRECNNVEECQRLVTQALALTAAAVHSENDSPATTNLAQSANADALPSPAIPVQENLEEEKKNETQIEPEYERYVSNSIPSYRPVRYRNLALPMAIGYDPSEDDNLPSFRKQSLVASWLLDNEGEEPEILEAFYKTEKASVPLPRRESLSVNNRRGSKSSFYKTRSSRQNSVSSVGQDSDFASADERPQSVQKTLLATTITSSHSPLANASPNPNQSETGFIDDEDRHRASLAGSTNSNYRDALEDNTNDVD